MTVPGKQKITKLIKQNIGSIAGFLVGGIGGYIYYKNVGCPNGACAITSNPYLTIIWGALLGYLTGSTFNKNDKSKIKENEN